MKALRQRLLLLLCMALASFLLLSLSLQVSQQQFVVLKIVEEPATSWSTPAAHAAAAAAAGYCPRLRLLNLTDLHSNLSRANATFYHHVPAELVDAHLKNITGTTGELNSYKS